jgi:hypothetical protein
MISGVELSQSAAAWYAIPNPIWYTAPCWISPTPNQGAS